MIFTLAERADLMAEVWRIATDTARAQAEQRAGRISLGLSIASRAASPLQRCPCGRPIDMPDLMDEENAR